MAGGLSCWPGREGGLTWQRQLVGELAYLSVRAASSPFPHRPFLLALRPELGSPREEETALRPKQHGPQESSASSGNVEQ